MKLVVDTNIIISALLKESICRKILFHLKGDLITLDFSEEEIREYKEYIQRKAKINAQELDLLLQKIKERCILLPDELIKEKMEEAKKIMWHIDPKDTPFIAAALASKADIWSDDEHFQKQNKVKVWKTKDLLEYYQQNG